MPSKMDHVADAASGGVELFRLSSKYAFPDFVKQAESERNFGVPAGTPVSVYADPIHKQFPCHTAASTWLSHLFYQEKRSEFHPKDQVHIEKKLTEYAGYWKIAAACDAVKARRTELGKSAESNLPDSSYAYVWAGDNGVKDRRYPLRNSVEVKVAADWLREHRDALPYATRRVMAEKILTKAAALGAGLGADSVEFLEKQAGRGVCDPDEVVAMIRTRALMVPAEAGVTFDEKGEKTGGLRDLFYKMAETVKDLPRVALAPASLVKLAETIDTLDRQNGIVGRYSDAVPRPEDVIFRATLTKAAAERVNHVATSSGKYYEKSAFGKLALADVEALFGTDFADLVKTPFGEVDCEKMAEQVSTLPRPDCQLLDGLLSDSGIVPVMHKAASAKQGFTDAEMEAVAANYARVA